MISKHSKFLTVMLISSLLSLGGCAIFDPVEKGTRDVFDDNGNKVATEDYAIGDKYTEYSKTVRDVSGAGKEVLDMQITAIASYTAVKDTDSVEVAAWKNAAGMVAVTSLRDTTPDIVAAVKYGKDKYDVSSETVGGVTSLGKVGVGSYAAMKVLDKAFDSAGDKTTIDGDNNSVEKTEIRNEVHANTTGDGSSPTVTTDSSAKCQTGDCAEDTGSESEWYLDIEGCSSQESYDACKCSKKPDTCE